MIGKTENYANAFAAFESVIRFDPSDIKPALNADISFMDFFSLMNSLQQNKSDGYLMIEINNDPRIWVGAVSDGKLRAASFENDKDDGAIGIDALKQILKTLYLSKVQPQGQFSFYLGDFREVLPTNIPSPLGQFELTCIISDLESEISH